MPTNTPKPRTPYTCLQPVRRGSHPPIGRLPHSRTTLPEPAVTRAPRGPEGAPRCRHRAPRPPHSPPARPRRRRRRYGDPRGPWRAGGTRCRETGGTLFALGQGRAAVPCPGEEPAAETPRCLCELLRRKPSRVGAAETRSSRPWRWASGQGQPARGRPGQVLPTARETKTLWATPRTCPRRERRRRKPTHERGASQCALLCLWSGISVLGDRPQQVLWRCPCWMWGFWVQHRKWEQS